MEDFHSRDGNLSSPGALASRTPANQQPANGVGVYTPCEAIWTGGVAVFVPGWLDL